MKKNTLFSLRTVAHSFRRLQLLRLVLNVPGEICEEICFGCHSSFWSLMAVSGKLFEAGRFLTFSAFRMGAYSERALIRGWVLIRISTVHMWNRHYFVACFRR